MALIKIITKSKTVTQTSKAETKKEAFFQCHCPGTKNAIIWKKDNTNDSNYLTLYVSKDKKFKIIAIVLLCCIVSFLFGCIVNSTIFSYHSYHNIMNQEQSQMQKQLTYKSHDESSIGNTCNISNNLNHRIEYSSVSYPRRNENSLNDTDIRIFYETLVHPGMILWLQERRYQTKQRQVDQQQNNNEDNDKMMNVAIINILHRHSNSNKDDASKIKNDLDKRMIAQEVLKYQNIHNIFLISITTTTASADSYNYQDTIQTEGCNTIDKNSNQRSSCALHRINIHMNTSDANFSSLLLTLSQSSKSSPLTSSSPLFDAIILQNDIQQYIISYDDTDVKSSVS